VTHETDQLADAARARMAGWARHVFVHDERKSVKALPRVLLDERGLGSQMALLGCWAHGGPLPSREREHRSGRSSPRRRAASAARFLVTEDVDDCGLDDLAGVDISAVNPDLFLSERAHARCLCTGD
jgi:hypothetical protein